MRGLGRAGILSADDVQVLVDGLEALATDLAAGRLAWDGSLEDVHMNIEAALAGKVGPLAGRLHTGRSRNDQVATDLRLWTRRAIDELFAALLDFERALVALAERDGTAVLPGTTHIQPAQPILFAHHLLAYVEMAERDRGRLADARARLNVSPLGSGALAGAGYPLDREATATELGFDGVSANSLDAVSDRDFVVETISAVALGMVHLSRLAEEITWWSNPRFGFVARRRCVLDRQLDDAQQEEPRSGRAGPWPRCPRHRGADRGPDAAQGPAAGVPARPPGERGAAVRRGRGVRDLAPGDGRFGRDADRRRGADARRGRRGLHDRDGRRRHARPPGRPVPGGPPRRRLAGRRSGGRRDSGWTRSRTRAVTAALAGSDDTTAAELADEPGIADELRAAASIDGALASCDVIGGTAPTRVAAALAAARERLDRA